VEAHRDRYGYEQPHADVEVVTVRVAGRARLAGEGAAVAHDAVATGAPAATATRPLFHEGTWHEAPVYRRDACLPGHRFGGPALIEQLDSTTVVLPGQAAEVDRWLNLRIRNTEGTER
jgi:N-methylhydantoinase A